MFQLNKESGYIEEVKDVEVNVNCIICDGTGLMSDVLEGDNTVCLCKEIDAQEDEIKIIDGKRYKLIN